jgi:hypothetical protein
VSDDDDDEKPHQIDRAKPFLDEAVDDLKALLSKLEDLNSLFPATRAFLAMQGVGHVRDLSPEKREELMAFLKIEREKLLKPPN